MKNNNDNLSKEIFIPIIDYIKNKKFDKALELIDNLSNQNLDIINKFKGNIYLNKKDWKNSLINYQKISSKNQNFEILNNIGVTLFKQGRLAEATTQFKKSIDKNSSFLPAYENLCITYKLMGNYELSLKFIVNSLSLNPKNNKLKNQLIDIFNYYEPKTFRNSIIEINKQIKELNTNNPKNELVKKSFIKKILNTSEEILSKFNISFNYPETQIFRRNEKNLNCKRHLTIFAEHKIIPRFCFNCYKVQISLENVVDLLKIYFYFNNLYLNNNNIRKCVVELRKNVSENYKGYIFANSIEEAESIKLLINNDLNKEDLNIKKIEIKHGCTEYYNKYELYKNVKRNITNQIYRTEWKKRRTA